MSEFTERENDGVVILNRRLYEIRSYLENIPEMAGPDLVERHLSYILGLQRVQGNIYLRTSFLGCLLAKQYLVSRFTMIPFDISMKPQGSPGLDIDEQTTTGERVIGEIKTTEPYGATDLGAQQKASFKKDFDKLNREKAQHKFFFLTSKKSYEITMSKMREKIPEVEVVLLGEQGEEHNIESKAGMS